MQYKIFSFFQDYQLKNLFHFLGRTLWTHYKVVRAKVLLCAKTSVGFCTFYFFSSFFVKWIISILAFFHKKYKVSISHLLQINSYLFQKISYFLWIMGFICYNIFLGIVPINSLVSSMICYKHLEELGFKTK